MLILNSGGNEIPHKYALFFMDSEVKKQIDPSLSNQGFVSAYEQKHEEVKGTPCFFSDKNEWELKDEINICKNKMQKEGIRKNEIRTQELKESVLKKFVPQYDLKDEERYVEVIQDVLPENLHEAAYIAWEYTLKDSYGKIRGMTMYDKHFDPRPHFLPLLTKSLEGEILCFLNHDLDLEIDNLIWKQKKS